MLCSDADCVNYQTANKLKSPLITKVHNLACKPSHLSYVDGEIFRLWSSFGLELKILVNEKKFGSSGLLKFNYLL